MGLNGSGTFERTDGTRNGASVWQNARDASVKIRSLDHDTHDQDIATAISTAIMKDGQTTITANLPMAGFRHTNVGNASARTDYASAGQVQDGAISWGGTSGGSANAQTVTLSPAPSAYVAGMRIAFVAGYTNTGTVTLNVNALGAKTIELGGFALGAGQVTTGELVEVVYDGTDFQMVSLRNSINSSTDIVFAADFEDNVSGSKITVGSNGVITLDAFDDIVFETSNYDGAGVGVQVSIDKGQEDFSVNAGFGGGDGARFLMDSNDKILLETGQRDIDLNAGYVASTGGLRLLLDQDLDKFAFYSGGSGVDEAFSIINNNIASNGVYDATTANAANVHINATGAQLQRSTSARKYKKDVELLTSELLAASLNIRGVTYRSRCAKDDPKRVHVGIIADDVISFVPQLVNCDEQGNPEGLFYERLTAIHQEHIRHLYSLVEALRN